MRVVNTVPLRLGLMVRPQSPRSRFFMGTSSQETAAQTFLVSSKAFEGVGGWLSKVRPADWTQKASEVSSRARTEIANLANNVMGKLGTDEGEKTAAVLLTQWQNLKDKADYDLAHAPGVLATWWDSVSRYFSDFGQGYTGGLSSFTSAWSDAWGIISNAAVENAGSVLRTYYDTVNRMMFLRDDLAQAKASGQVSQNQIVAQAAKIKNVEASLGQVQNRFASLSGGQSIDALAQKNFGNFQSLSGIAVPVIAVAAAIGLIALAWAIHDARQTVKEINPFRSRDPDSPSDPNDSNGLGSVGAIGLIVLLAIPLYLINKD